MILKINRPTYKLKIHFFQSCWPMYKKHILMGGSYRFYKYPFIVVEIEGI